MADPEIANAWLRFALTNRARPAMWRVLRELDVHYKEPWRTFHNWQRIKELVTTFRHYRRLFEHPAEAELAIYHQEARRDPESDGKLYSAELAFNNAKEAFPYLDPHRASAYVIATMHPLQGDHPDAQLLAGLDLLLLARPWPDFMNDINALQLEHADHLTHEEIGSATKRWAQRLLEGPIYHHPALRGFEDAARENLESYVMWS